MAHSRVWRIARFLGLVEDRATAPRAGSPAWWRGLAAAALGVAVVAALWAVLR